ATAATHNANVNINKVFLIFPSIWFVVDPIFRFQMIASRWVLIPRRTQGNGPVSSTLATGRLWQVWASRHQALTVELAQYSKRKSNWRSIVLGSCRVLRS